MRKKVFLTRLSVMMIALTAFLTIPSDMMAQGPVIPDTPNTIILKAGKYKGTKISENFLHTKWVPRNSQPILVRFTVHFAEGKEDYELRRKIRVQLKADKRLKDGNRSPEIGHGDKFYLRYGGKGDRSYYFSQRGNIKAKHLPSGTYFKLERVTKMVFRFENFGSHKVHLRLTGELISPSKGSGFRSSFSRTSFSRTQGKKADRPNFGISFVIDDLQPGIWNVTATVKTDREIKIICLEGLEVTDYGYIGIDYYWAKWCGFD